MSKNPEIPEDSADSDSSELGWEDVKVVSRSYEDWEVELFLPLDQISEEILPLKLKKLKKLLSKKYNVPLHDLQYNNILHKEITDDGILTHLRISRISLEKGKPKFSFQSGISSAGIPYSDMACYVDLYSLDEFERSTTPDRVVMLMKSEGVIEELIDRKAIHDAVIELQETGKPVLGVKAAQGRFPDAGLDAEVEFYFHAQPSSENMSEYISSRKVCRHDLLCNKTSPTEGKTAGLSVRGRTIRAKRGFDITLEARKNVRPDMSHEKMFADADGLVIVRREERTFIAPAGQKVVPSKVIVRIDPLMIIEAESDKEIDITTRDSVEIRGNLKIGSRIISSGEVHIDGNVSSGSMVHAADDLFVSGSVQSGALSSDKNIISSGDVRGSNISASGKVVINGTATDTSVIGLDVQINRIMGGNITAGTSLTVNELGAGEDGVSATICVATRDFLQTKIDENNEFLAGASENLDKLRKLFGEDIINEVIPQNVQQQFLKFMSHLKGVTGNRQIPKKTVLMYKKLLHSIEPLRRLISEKELENLKLEKQIRQSSTERKIVIVKEKITAKTKVVMSGKSKILNPAKGRTEISD